MSEIEKVAQLADFIVNGYSFICENTQIRVLNLNDTSRAAVLDLNGEVLETSMDDIEISIVQAYWEKNKQFAED
jgi:hypothetical protein